MINNKVVIDSCVFSKLFLLEPDRDQAVNLMKTLGKLDYTIIVPQLFFYEVLSVIAYAKYDLDKAVNLIEAYKKSNLQIVEPDIEVLKTTVAMTDSGHPKSGYPSFYDAIYHALALCLNCTFITADKRHYQKTRHLGSIVLLQDWESVLD